MPKISLLIVDSKVSASSELKKAFELKGYEVASVRSGAQALRLLTPNSFDLMLLDLEVTDCNGIELLKTARKKCSDLLIVIKTARATLESTLTAIKYGVIDYLIEPLEAFEIESAIENVLQKKLFELDRNQKIISIIKAVKTLESGNSLQGSFLDIETSENKDMNPAISLDSIKRQFVLSNLQKGESLQVELTSHEFDLLSYLMQFSGKVLSSRELALNTLGYSNISENEAKGIIRPHISRLRKKIETNSDHPDFIRTIRGRGYVFTFRK